MSVTEPRDAGNWATSTGRLSVDADRAGAGWAVTGKRLTSPLQGFGRMWQRTYTAQLGTVATPTEVISTWKAEFGSFWPKGARFYGALEGIRPGDVAPISVSGGGVRVTTGVLVLYADDESFTFMTPEGHMFAGMITFSAYERDGGTMVQVQLLIRSNDPVYEAGMPVMKRMEDRFWVATVRNLAMRLGAPAGLPVDIQAVVVDRRRVWKNSGNVRHNAGIRGVLRVLRYPVARPLRAARARRAGKAAPAARA